MEAKKYLVIGNPINHSLSPKLHNHWLKENNINAIYDKVKLEESEIKNFIQNIKNQKIIGCNVTIPFKKTVIPFLDRLSLEAKQTQSVNTIIFDRGKLVGHNTDIAGFEKAIKNLDFIIKRKKILILGAGGVVPSLIFALKKMNVLNITISNRTLQKAKNLKNIFKTVNVIEWGSLPEFDVVINATSLGLNNEKINLDFSNFGKNKLFYDIIYNPSETDFLKKGKKFGNIAENGKLMFVYQAFEAFKLWHGIEPEINASTLKLLDHD
ncbi:shikimate dehydrogenase [Candidatus Pelagibacter sp.]|nr:shikimate dehydrogenase [Candidatus Pelagibacter sp.]